MKYEKYLTNAEKVECGNVHTWDIEQASQRISNDSSVEKLRTRSQGKSYFCAVSVTKIRIGKLRLNFVVVYCI